MRVWTLTDEVLVRVTDRCQGGGRGRALTPGCHYPEASDGQQHWQCARIIEVTTPGTLTTMTTALMPGMDGHKERERGHLGPCVELTFMTECNHKIIFNYILDVKSPDSRGGKLYGIGLWLLLL